MDPFTIFLDANDPRRSKLFWAFHVTMSVFWIYQGGTKSEPEWFAWMLIIGGILALLTALSYLIIKKKYGRRRLIFNAQALEVKTNFLFQSK